MGKRIALAMALSAMIWGTSHAGWFEDAVKGALEGAGKRAVDETTNSTYQGAKGKAKESVKEGAPEKNGDADAPAQQKPPTQKPASGTAAPPAGDAGGGHDIASAEQIYSKYDFVPGDKVIFYDDFSDTDVGEFPRKWTLNGPEGRGSNAIEVAEYGGKRFLRSTPAEKNQSQHPSTQYVRLDRKGDLPEKFTIEFDAHFSELGGGYPSQYGLFLLKGDGHPGWAAPGVVWVSGKRCVSMNTETHISRADNKVHHVAVSVNGTFVKAYVDNQRVVNDPDGIPRPIQFVGIRIESAGSVANDKVMFTNFRLAEGGKDIQSALSTDGKIVTHGILFDTGKDVIRPESLPTLKTILGLLEGDPALKFSVEGHTDNQGGTVVNQPLSERRAAAVKSWLEGKGTAAGRLQSKGWGDTKPIDANDTPEGRANNRRVEFVKVP